MKILSQDDYLSVNEDVILHLTPSGARVTIHYPDEISLDRGMRKIPVANINLTARDILLSCIGEQTARSVINELISKSSQNNMEDDQIIREVMDFFQQLINYDVLIPHSLPHRLSPHVTGSIDFFMPQHMSIELTANCNLRCIYCYRDAGPSHKEYLPGDLLIRILGDLEKYGLQSVELTGGEPLLHPEFKQIFNYCVDHFLRVVLLSNGCLINQNITDLLGSHKEKVIVQVDIDGNSPNTHDRIRGVPGSFIKTTNAVRLLAKAGVKTRVAMNVTKTNLDEIENTLLLSKQIGAHWFAFTPVLDLGRGKALDPSYSLEQVKYITDLSKRLHEEYEGFIGYLDHDAFVEMFKNEGNCGAGHKVAVLGPTGKVRPCPLLPEDVLTFGDLTKDSVETVFSNPIIPMMSQLKSPNTDTCSGCLNELYCRYCHTRGIIKLGELQSGCNWGKVNCIKNWLDPEKIKTDSTADGQCPRCF
jgi:radical SAM protein with 4Fe4S-binding SPASM domain